MSVLDSPRRQERPKLVALPSPGLSRAEDGALAMAVRAGDPRAAAVLWDRFSPQLRGMMRRTLGPDHDVEELLLEVYVELFRHVGGLRNIHALRSFLIGIAIRVMRVELRRRYVRRLFLRKRARQPGRNDPSAHHTLSGLYEALDRMRPDTRLAFTLRHFEGMLISEIAETLGVSAATVKRRLTRGAGGVIELADRDPALSRDPNICRSVGSA